MQRREFIGLVGGAVAWPVAGVAQSRVQGKIGVLSFGRVANNSTLAILRSAWNERGYVEGETVLLRGAGGDSAALPGLAKELIDLGVSALIAVGVGPVKAARTATATTPIVAIDLETDPVRAGYAASFARPGGNITGLFMDMPSLAGKWIDLLREAAPSIERIAIIWDPATGPDQLESAKAAARSKGINGVVLEVPQRVDYDELFGALEQRNRTGIVQLTAPATRDNFTNIAEAALRHRLPTISFQKANARAGALISYGPLQEDYFARAVALADNILKGAKAGELPLEQPARFELIVNLKTAKALGLTLPPTLLATADEVVE